MGSIFQTSGPANGTTSKVLHPGIHTANPKVVSANGIYLFLEDGHKVLDSSAGPGVACIGHGNTEVRDAVVDQMNQVSYLHSLTFANQATEDLAEIVVNSTNGVMAKATIMSSGSEAVEAAMKLARKYFFDKGEPQRVRFIAREGAFHGTTLASLALTAKPAVRRPFEPIMPTNNKSFVSMPNLYRGLRPGETETQYAARLAKELDDEFERVGPNTVCAFIAETVAGTSMGCLTAPSGYFAAVRAVCDKHSALLILDEVLCGLGRTGSMHAWEQEGVYPDIQTVAKGLAGGYAPISMLLMNNKIVDVIQAGSGFFNHGHTYSSHAVACAAGVAVQRIIKRDNIIQNVQITGERLGNALKMALGNHKNVGNIRGRGLMWAVEFVKDRESKQPFPLEERVAGRIQSTGMREPWRVSLYPGTGTADTVLGDHITITPPLNITVEEVDLIVDLVKGVVEEVLGS
ncbi:aminotransferase, class III [Stachybotrys elegans]|uniref:Aminotransferase, class III n=1 Tax=Stachybotrys elegans TaxID=80388 RepID=A0A8K0SIT2_9HYPO|nr:aminotransferase, class III [Stachybotrys elegans]